MVQNMHKASGKKCKIDNLREFGQVFRFCAAAAAYQILHKILRAQNCRIPWALAEQVQHMKRHVSGNAAYTCDICECSLLCAS